METAFTIVSANNIVFLHSSVRVYSGNQQLRWQGTTTQAIFIATSRIGSGHKKDTCELSCQNTETFRKELCVKRYHINKVGCIYWNRARVSMQTWKCSNAEDIFVVVGY